MTTAATQTIGSGEPPSASRVIASEVRAEMGRQMVTRRGMATRLGVSHTWVNRRVGPSADLEISFEEAERVAAALGVSVLQLLDPWLRAWRDSNSQPSDPDLAERLAPVIRLADRQSPAPLERVS